MQTGHPGQWRRDLWRPPVAFRAPHKIDPPQINSAAGYLVRLLGRAAGHDATVHRKHVAGDPTRVITGEEAMARATSKASPTRCIGANAGGAEWYAAVAAEIIAPRGQPVQD